MDYCHLDVIWIYGNRSEIFTELARGGFDNGILSGINSIEGTGYLQNTYSYFATNNILVMQFI